MTTENGRTQATETDNTPTTESYSPLRIDTSKPPVTGERMTLFWIDDREFTGPKVITGSLAFRALETTVKYGKAAGAWFCLTEAVEEETVTALLKCEHLSYEQARDFLAQISAMYYGQAMGIMGK